MALTVSGLNLATIHTCESTTGTNASGTDSVDYKEGSNSCYWVAKTSGDNDLTFTPATTTVDLSTYSHVRFWGLFAQGSLINLKASGGIQLGLSDGTNTGYWYVGGRDTYPGGWYNFCIDVSQAVDAGTKPTGMNAISQVIIRINLTSGAKNFANTWVDNITRSDGLIATGDVSTGTPFDFGDIFAADDATSLGIGIMRNIGGVYFTTGALQIGSDSAYADFNSVDEVLVFENRDVTATLYGITVKDPGGAQTQFQLGTSVGGAGISGPTITVASRTQTALWDLDGSTDTDVDFFKLYGSTFVGADGMKFPPTATGVEILNCTFSACGTVEVNTATVTNCNFISSPNSAILISSTSHNTSYCNFIDCDTGVEFDTANTYSLQYCYFTTSTGQYDIEFSDPTTGSDLIINATKGDPASYIITGNGDTVTINNTVVVTITTVDVLTNPIAGARVYLVTDDTAATVIFNTTTDTAGEVSDTGYNYSGDQAVVGWTRKGSSAPYYETAPISGTITDNGLDLTIQLNLDQ